MRRLAIDMPNGKKLSRTFLVLMLLLVFIGPMVVRESASRVQLMTPKSPLLEIPHTYMNLGFIWLFQRVATTIKTGRVICSFTVCGGRMGQVCNVTRIASGCSDEAAVQQRHKQYIQSSMSVDLQYLASPETLI